MNFLSLLGVSLFAGHVSAFRGQLAASAYTSNPNSPGFIYQNIYLTDYTTGSTYAAQLYGGFNDCTTSECPVYFKETSDGGYGFNALMWRTSNGCHNIDFKGALDAEHGYSCGSLPCYITA